MSRPTRADAGGRAYLDLQNLARRQGRPTQALLVMYVLERFLARLAAGPHTKQFVLKGGMLLAARWHLRKDHPRDQVARPRGPAQPLDGEAALLRPRRQGQAAPDRGHRDERVHGHDDPAQPDRVHGCHRGSGPGGRRPWSGCR
jgi:hypothetical protein